MGDRTVQRVLCVLLTREFLGWYLRWFVKTRINCQANIRIGRLKLILILKGQCYERRENSSNCKDPYEENSIILKFKIALIGAYFLDSWLFFYIFDFKLFHKTMTWLQRVPKPSSTISLVNSRQCLPLIGCLGIQEKNPLKWVCHRRGGFHGIQD